MPAAQASEVLNLFASGRGPADICTIEGQALLRGAVRAYSTEMHASGLAWPIIPGLAGEAEHLNHVDISVMIAFAAGFVRSADFRGPARHYLAQLNFAEFPRLHDMRRATHVACEDVVALQQAASRFGLEQSRVEEMARRPQSNASQMSAERARRQADRVGRARLDMQRLADVVQMRIDAQN
jgi:hypothetical protein